ncbi:MAG: carbohydrate kinase [Ignavibacteria bacterium]|nr:carbohydrate kinase [Ignavibacteria bacterium]
MNKNYLLGFDVGSSSIKASLIDADNGQLIDSASSPDQEMKIESPVIGWAEQDPDIWWNHVVTATRKIISRLSEKNFEIIAIGISYQMHGLVLVDKNFKVLRPSIIWCDSRAVEIGNNAFKELGQEYCLGSCLNSPGNFTASKLAWVKKNQPEIYSRIHKIMLPGDYIALKLSGEIYTTVSGLSEGIFWDFNTNDISQKVLNYFGFDRNIIPDIVPTFSNQGKLTRQAAEELGIKSGIPISYRAGDQPNNALSLNVLKPGEIAATAGTSGVIYGVTDKNLIDNISRVNTFAHVNYSQKNPNKGVLLCINGTGILYSWIKLNILEGKYSYNELNSLADQVEIGSHGLICIPFGNGAERVLGNKDVQCQFSGINFNIHGKGHLVRAAQEGIAYSFRYGLDVMKSIGMNINIVKAGNTNLFQSKIFQHAFVNTCNAELELYNTDGSQGAARGAGIGIGYYSSEEKAFDGLKIIDRVTPSENLVDKYYKLYQNWKMKLNSVLEEK